jgi:hypothetical protein
VQRGANDRETVRGATPAPDRLDLPQEFVDGCRMDGLPDPRKHVAACLLNARKKGLVRVDWLAELKHWLVRERNFSARDRRGAAPDDDDRADTVDLSDHRPRESGT